MPISIKTADEIEKMRTAGQLAAEVLEMIGAYVKNGVTTGELDRLCHDHIVNKQHAVPAPLGYRPAGYKTPFPKSVCTSVNHVVCHGIPGSKKLKDGDIINIDVTVIKDGYHGDTSKMFYVGKPAPGTKFLIDLTYECMKNAIRIVKPGIRLGDIGHAIQTPAEKNNCSVVREFCGHGIGKRFHEDPQILHYGKPGTGIRLEAGMTFTIEPMINRGKRKVKLQRPRHIDEWTVITADRSLSAQWEHTVLVTDDGHEVLTRRSEEDF